MSQALTPEWGLNIQNQVPVTSRPDFLLPTWDRRAELGSVIGRTKHPGSKPGFAHQHHHRQTELGQHVAGQAAVQSENQIQAKIEGIETVDSPLMAAAFFAVIGSGEWGKKNVSRLLVTALVLAGCIGTIRQESTPTPENPPAVVVVTNTPLPDLGLTHTATLAATQTETPFFGGGPELPGGSPDQIRSFLETGINLPVTDCIASPETGGNREVWDDWIKTLVENGASEIAINELEATINAKLESWGASDSTSLELCAGGDGGWSLVIRDKSSGLFWWSYDLENNRFADRPDRVFNDRDWQFRPMPREGLKSGLEVEIMMINGWPLAVSVDSAGRPIQYFDPVLREFINFYPDPDTATPAPTPTRTATSTSTATNTPRPTAIPATRIPTAIPTSTPVPSPTALPGPTPWTERGLLCDPKWSPIDQQCEVIVYPSKDLPFSPWDDTRDGALVGVETARQLIDGTHPTWSIYGPWKLTP